MFSPVAVVVVVVVVVDEILHSRGGCGYGESP